MKDRKGLIRWLRDLFCGFLIGAGAILPGVSGGVLAVVFGIYQPFMEVLTQPRQALPRYGRWIFPLAAGWCAGFLVFARGIALMLDAAETAAIWLFIGLIVGTLPSLFQEAGKQGRPRSAWVSFALCGGLVFASLFYVGRVAAVHVSPNFWWYSFCGALWGMSVVIPGMTSSSVLMALGLYQPLMQGLSRLDIPVLAATLPGMLVTIVLLARLVRWFFRKHYAVAYHGMLGVVAATTAVIVPTRGVALWEAALSAVCCLGGFAIAYLLSRLDRRLRT